MRTLAFLGLAASIALLPGAAEAQSESGANAPSAGVAMAAEAMRNMHRTTRTISGGHQGGTTRLRGGNNRFFRSGGGNNRFFRSGGGSRHFTRGTRFFVGGFLPSFFLAPQFYLSNYPAYGLSQPYSGHRWVRYYDDAYLVDDRGYIRDTRYGVPYDGYAGGSYADAGYDDGYFRDDRRYDDRYDRRYDDRDDRRRYDDRYDRRRSNAGDTIAGAVAGGVVGGVAGNLIAGRGDRTEGTIIGAGIGAVAGGALGAAAGRDRRGGYRNERGDRDERGYRDDRQYGEGYYQGGYRDDPRYGNGPVPEYVGDGDYYPPQAPHIAYDENYQYDAEIERGATYPAPPAYRPPVYTDVQVSGPARHSVTQSNNGFSQTATTTIVLNSAPAVTTTTFIEEEVEYVAARRRAHRPARRRAAPARTCRVTCQCVCR